MKTVQAAILGILQGITEFLPVSSSGHLVLLRSLMGLKEVPVLFDVILHVATLIVIVWVFRQRVWSLLTALFRFITRRSRAEDWPNLLLALHLFSASIITAMIGLGVFSLEGRDNPTLVSLFLLASAAILLSTLCSQEKCGIHEIGWWRVMLLGMVQGIGVFPGISRSGITIGMGMISGLDRKSAGEFSFLLSIPAVFAAFLLSLRDVGELTETVPIISLSVGFFAALATGYGSLRLLLWLITGGRLWIFALYLLPVGIWGVIHFGF